MAGKPSAYSAAHSRSARSAQVRSPTEASPSLAGQGPGRISAPGKPMLAPSPFASLPSASTVRPATPVYSAVTARGVQKSRASCAFNSVSNTPSAPACVAKISAAFKRLLVVNKKKNFCCCTLSAASTWHADKRRRPHHKAKKALCFCTASSESIHRLSHLLCANCCLSLRLRICVLMQALVNAKATII